MHVFRKIKRSFSKKVIYILHSTFYIFFFSAVSLQLHAQDNTLAKKDTLEVRFLNQRKFFVYKVEKGETLYSISKKFKIPQEEISEFNRDLKDGVKAKMKLWIPAYSHLKKEEKSEVKEKEERPEEKIHSVAIMLALNISKNFSLDLSLVDSNFVGDVMDKETITNLEFYEGVLKAVDSLKSLNFKVHLYTYDTEGDSLITAGLLKNPELKKMDLIISNGSTNIIKLINEFSKRNHVRFSSCTMNAGDLFTDNKEAIAMLPSSLIQCREMGKFAAKKFKKNNSMILKTTFGKENDRSYAFRRGWKEISEEKLTEVDYSKGFIKAIKDSLSAKLNNFIFVPSSNEDFVSTLVSGLKDYSEEYRISLIGLPTWQYFETIDPILLELLDVHIFSSSFIRFSSIPVVNFRKSFYNTYNTDPGDAAFEGFDMMMVLGSGLMKYGKKFNERVTENIIEGLYSSYKFEKASENSPVENHYISVCRYQNYELKKINE